MIFKGLRKGTAVNGMEDLFTSCSFFCNIIVINKGNVETSGSKIGGRSCRISIGRDAYSAAECVAFCSFFQ